VFVHRQAVEADLVGLLHQADEHLVGLANLDGVGEVRGRVHPGAAMLLREIGGEVGIGDFGEPMKFHAFELPFMRLRAGLLTEWRPRLWRAAGWATVYDPGDVVDHPTCVCTKTDCSSPRPAARAGLYANFGLCKLQGGDVEAIASRRG